MIRTAEDEVLSASLNCMTAVFEAAPRGGFFSHFGINRWMEKAQ
jgi:hypothetical protein